MWLDLEAALLSWRELLKREPVGVDEEAFNRTRESRIADGTRATL